MKPRSTHRNLIPGRIGLALVALLAASAAPLPAQEQREKGKEPERNEAPRERPGQRPGVETQRPGMPAQHPGMPAQAPGQHPGMPNQAPGQRPGMPNQAPGMRPGMPNQAPGMRPGMPNQAPGMRPGMPNHPQAGRPGPVNRPPMNVVRTPNGGQVQRGPGGAIREVHTPNGAVIHYAPDGMRHVEVARPGGQVFFANGNGRGGFVQRPLVFHNQAFVQRTYVEHGVAFARVYRPYAWHGATFNVYMPVHYYRPGFYAWAYHPWGAPVRYRWGWEQHPWWGYYRGYYTPYPVYRSPMFWLADFMVAATLQAAYQDRMDNAAAAAPPPASYDQGGMSPEARQAIADEVRRQVDQERADQQAMAQNIPQPASAPPPLFADNVSRIFLVPSGTVAYANGQEKLLPEGDVLQLQGAPQPGATYADVVVMSSRDPGVPQGSVVSVSLQDLQEMQNRMRANIDQGLGDLQAHQGQGGLPPVPQQNLGTSDAPYASAVQPDPNAATDLSQVAQDANSSGQAVLSQATQPPPAAAPSQPITLGMSVDQVHAILGMPGQSANLGSRRIEVYPSFKITFNNGVVANIQ